MTPPSLQEIARLVDFAEAAAWADQQRAASPRVAAELGLRVACIGSATVLIAEEVDLIQYNRVLGLGVAEPATEEMVDGIVGLYRPLGVPFAGQISPAARPAELAGWLEARGIRRADNWAKLFRDAQPPAAARTDLRVESIGAEHASAFAEIACGVFGIRALIHPWVKATVGRPGWRHYLAFVGEMPVATGALFVQDGTGWIGWNTTVASHRGRGAQSALIARRIADAGAMGCRWLVADTAEDLPDSPNPSYHNLLRAGFQRAYQRPNYVFQPGRVG